MAIHASNNPNECTPSTPGAAVWGGITGDIQTQADLIALIESVGGTPGYELKDFGAAAIANTAGSATTQTEIITTINAAGFTVTAGKLIKLNLIVLEQINDAPNWVTLSYDFKKNNITGTWGDSSDNDAITYADLILRNRRVLSSAVAPLETSEFIDLGNISDDEIEDHINALDPSTVDWENLANDGTTYYFSCVKSGESQTYEYVGSLPATLGSGNDTVTNVDFNLIASSDTNEPAVITQYHEFACSDESSDLETGTVYSQRLLRNFNTCVAFNFGVATAPTGSTLIIDVKKNGVSIFDTKPSIDIGEFTTITAATPQVITAASVDFAAGDLIEVIIDQIGSTTAGTNLKAQITYNS